MKCITSVESNAQYMVEAGNPAARAAAYDDPEVREAFPMADLIRDSIDDAGPRPITPYYGDVSTSVQRTWHPSDDGRSRPRRLRRTDTYMSEVLRGRATAVTTTTSTAGIRDRRPRPPPAPAGTSDRLRHERRLGLRLTAPAFIVMILVTAYPLGYAVVLSLFRYRLTDPDGREFVGLQNYVTVLTDPVWWSAVSTTAIITVVSVAIELVLGFGFAWVMYRILRGRSVDPHRDPGPLRDHHRRLGLRLAVRLPARLRLRQPVVRPRATSTGSASAGRACS